MFYTHAEFSEMFSQAVLLLAVSMETGIAYRTFLTLSLQS